MRSETSDPRVRVLPGDQVVVRYGPVVALLGPPGPATVALRDALAEAVAADDVVTAVAEALEPVTGAAVVLVDGTPPVVVMRGDLEVRALGAVGELRLNAATATGVVRQPLLGDFSQVRLGPGKDQPDPWVDLAAGTVLGGGAVVALADSPVATASPVHAAAAEADSASGPASGSGPVVAPGSPAASRPATEPAPTVTAEWRPPAPEPLPEPPAQPEPVTQQQAASHAAGFTSVSLLAHGAADGVADGVAAEPREPLPVESAPVTAAAGADAEASSAAAPPRPGAVQVEGLNCGRGHFNHPHAANCAWCGLGMLQVSHVLVQGERPPLGVLVVDEQATFTLDAGYVVGRRPSLDPAVDGVTLRELVLSDPDRSVSRVHATIRLDGWDVLVEDRESGIGTWVIAGGNGQGQPERLEPGRPRVLRSGEHVHVGPHRLTFHSHHLR